MNVCKVLTVVMFAFVSLCSCAGLVASSSAQFEMTDCVFKNNVASTGGLLVMTGGASLISLCTFDSNEVAEGVGILKISNTEVNLNTLEFKMNVGREILITNCVVSKEKIWTDKCIDDNTILINDNADLSGITFACGGNMVMTALVNPYMTQKNIRIFGSWNMLFLFRMAC